MGRTSCGREKAFSSHPNGASGPDPVEMFHWHDNNGSPNSTLSDHASFHSQTKERLFSALVQGSIPVIIGQDGCALTYNLNWVSGADGES